jgi:hypothetical protein
MENPLRSSSEKFIEGKETWMYNIPFPGTPPTPGLGTPTALIGPSHPKNDHLYQKYVIHENSVVL